MYDKKDRTQLKDDRGSFTSFFSSIQKFMKFIQFATIV